MNILVALGGNALLRRGQTPSAQNQLDNVRVAVRQLAPLARAHRVLLTHGNGPQVGLLALEGAALRAVPPYPLDMLGAQTQGLLGYLLQQELGNLLPASPGVATLVTRVEVAPHDPAFGQAHKPIGPLYTPQEALQLAQEHGWTMAPDGNHMRRVVASPAPLRVLELASIRALMALHTVVIAAGGGGIPVVRGADGHTLQGVEAVVDKDLCSALLAQQLQLDCLVLATDVDAVYLHWGQPGQRALHKTTPQELARHTFAQGSMGPKVQAACQFVQACKRSAFIGALQDIAALVQGQAGTEVVPD